MTLLAGAALFAPGAALADHHEPAERGVAVAEQVNLKGKVIAINAETRTVTVEGELGRQVEIRAPKNSPNFDQIKVGDPVKATYVEAIAIGIAPVADAKPGASASVDVSTAPKGATPGAVISERIELRAVVKAVDIETRQVTLDVPAGGERTIKVGEAVNIERVKVGEQVSVVLTRALAISIDKQ
ncbi:MAG: hypothetical protein JRG82_12410 [Deltaproteobacteria bacterium]|nr:hypothetical protein [Deltaproteobacteria bacterium]